MDKKLMRKRKGEWITISLSLAALVAVGGSHSIVAAQEVSSTYTVQSGDTLYSIASRNGLSLTELKQINSLASDIILPGQTLLIKQNAPVVEEETKPTTEVNEIDTSDNTPETTVTNNVEPLTSSGSTYVVQSGDYLYSIATKYGVTVQNLVDWNNLSSNYLYAGDVLNISQPSSSQPVQEVQNNDNSSTTQNNSSTSVYVVKAGEWVSKIASQYGITDGQLREWNNLTSNLIHPGDRLVVKKSSSTGNNTGNNSTGNNSNNSGTSNNSKTHTVRSGDYLYSIANRYGVTVQNIKDWNNLTSNYIYSGDVLNVAKPSSTTPAPKPSEEKPEENNSSTGNNNTSTVHVVKAGEWVSKIASQYGITDSQLRDWNNLTSNLIHPGDRLVVKKSTPSDNNSSEGNNNSDNNGSTTAKTHTVRSGDYLYSIANRYGITVQNIKDWNNLTSNYIYSGDVLNVSKPSTSTPTPKPSDEDKEENNSSTGNNNSNTIHVVKAGEWVSKIASQYGITDAQLRQWNNLTSNLIHPGDRLVVTKPSSSNNNSSNNGNSNNNGSSNTAKTYTVISGDYLYRIATTHGISVQDLISWNNLSSNYVYAGDVLIVSRPSSSNNGGQNSTNPGTNQGIPDLSSVTPTMVNYDVKLNGKTQAIRSTLSYTGRTYQAVDHFGQRFTVNREFRVAGNTFLELLNSNGTIIGYVPKSASVEVPQGKNVVYIDAGHGGTETGSAANNAKEKDLNLNITSQLSRILRNQGYIVYETRTNDKTVPLSQRHLEPNNIMPDAYISVHHNAMPIPNTAHGIVTLYHDPSIDEKGYETQDHHIGTSIIPEGKRLSNAIQNSLVAITGANNMGTRAQNLHVTRMTDVPATLVELGFQDHDAEFRKLVNPSYQQKLINGLVNGINAYFGHTR